MKRIAEAAIRDLTHEGAVGYYTDGAVDPITHKSESSFYCQGHRPTEAFRLYDNCSKLQTELVEIYQALHHAREGECNKMVIES